MYITKLMFQNKSTDKSLRISLYQRFGKSKPSKEMSKSTDSKSVYVNWRKNLVVVWSLSEALEGKKSKEDFESEAEDDKITPPSK